jgi:hypothetical protein
MKNQAFQAGLLFKSTDLEEEGWSMYELQAKVPENSLTAKWWFLEFIPDKYRTYNEQQHFKWYTTYAAHY